MTKTVCFDLHSSHTLHFNVAVYAVFDGQNGENGGVLHILVYFLSPVFLYSVNGIDKLMKMYAQKSNCSTIKKRLYLLAFIPSTCMGAFFTVFQETAFFAGVSVKGLALFLH